LAPEDCPQRCPVFDRTADCFASVANGHLAGDGKPWRKYFAILGPSRTVSSRLRPARQTTVAMPNSDAIISRMIGKFSNRVLLTGAGWSRNWGGQLANEVWSSLIGHQRIRNNGRLRDLLVKESAFEQAMGMTRAAPYTALDRQDLEQAVLDTFIAIDREICRPDHLPWINMYNVQKLLFRFWGQPHERNSAGYLFTA
jgi:hypothetical protein